MLAILLFDCSNCGLSKRKRKQKKRENIPNNYLIILEVKWVILVGWIYSSKSLPMSTLVGMCSS